MNSTKFNLVICVSLFLILAPLQFSFSANKVGESFKSATFPPTGWRAEHVAGLGGSWYRSTSGYHSAPACAQSDGALLGDNFLITKQFTPVSGDSLVFYVSSNYVLTALGRLEVKVSTTDSIAASFFDFLIPIQITLGLLTPNVYYRQAISLNDYAGVPIYIAFRHIEVAGLFGTVRLDGIVIGGVDLDLTVLMEGHVGETGVYTYPRRDRDTVTVAIHSAIAPFDLVESKKVYLDTLGKKVINYVMPVEDENYYIVVDHRNSIRTWSRSGGEQFSGGSHAYDFTTGVNKAFGNNLKIAEGYSTLFTGDANKDGIVDLTDIVMIFNDNTNFVSGPYVVTDLNWEEFVDLSDLRLCYNNSIIFAQEIAP